MPARELPAAGGAGGFNALQKLLTTPAFARVVWLSVQPFCRLSVLDGIF
jgi:hypothetical protein